MKSTTFGCIVIMTSALLACTALERTEDKSASGLNRVNVTVKVGQDGMTVEQRNIKKRIEAENDPGSVKHLYITSTESGQVLLYSTVKGKVTSSGKRLTPQTTDEQHALTIKGNAGNIWTTEIMQDDGTYGSSIPYLYWWDTQDRYHQHYIAGGQMMHISNQPLVINKITNQIEIAGADQSPAEKQEQ